MNVIKFILTALLLVAIVANPLFVIFGILVLLGALAAFADAIRSISNLFK